MKIKLVNPSYSYNHGVVNYTVEAQIIDDTDVNNPVILYSEHFSARVNIDNQNWPTILANHITSQIQKTVGRFQEVMLKIQNAFPTATSPDEAVQLFTQQLENQLNQ